jgi:hypothetical protein
VAARPPPLGALPGELKPASGALVRLGAQPYPRWMNAPPSKVSPWQSQTRSLRRLALILRPVPTIFRTEQAETDSLRGRYYGRLWQGWSSPRRLLSMALDLARKPRDGDELAWEAYRLGFARRNLAEIYARRRTDAPLEHFLDQDERKGMHAIINHAALPLDRNPLKNKALFEARCAALGLPIPATIKDAAAAEQAGALISKPGIGSKGKGIYKLVRQPGGDWVASDGSVRVGQSELGQWLDRQSSAGRVVQACLKPSEDLADKSPGALPTLRVVSILNEQGEIETADSVLKLSIGPDKAADNFNNGNLGALVGADGRLSSAIARVDGGFIEVERHPLSGAPIAGDQVAPAFRRSQGDRVGHRPHGPWAGHHRRQLEPRLQRASAGCRTRDRRDADERTLPLSSRPCSASGMDARRADPGCPAAGLTDFRSRRSACRRDPSSPTGRSRRPPCGRSGHRPRPRGRSACSAAGGYGFRAA